MKATCKKSFPILEGVLDVGDVVEIEVIRSTREEVLHSGRCLTTDENNILKWRVCEEAKIIRPAGSYIGYRFQSKNGNTYSDNEIFGMIGYKTLADIFEK